MKAYLLVVPNLYCNYKCSYCIQQKSSLDVRTNSKKIDVDLLLPYLKKNRIARSVSVLGGEATLHPDFDRLMEGLLLLYRKVVLTTNLNGKWYEDFGTALGKMKKWGRKVKWNTTYHPAWQKTEEYIDRIRQMKAEGIKVEQVATPDTADLTEETAQKLINASVGWKIQPFTGRDEEGVMRPRSWDDIRKGYQFAFDPTKYIENYDEYCRECEDASFDGNDGRERMVTCKTPRYLIGPDNMVYPCHRHLYMQDRDYACGMLQDADKEKFRFKWSRWSKHWTLECGTKCNPCDFQEVKITPA